MTVDISPITPEGRLIVESYGPGRFRISGTAYQGSLVLCQSSVAPWTIEDPAQLGPDSLQALDALAPPYEVVLLGCGAKMTLIPAAIRAAWRERGLPVDIMDTGAACRTYNVLVAEERRVAAALIAI